MYFRISRTTPGLLLLLCFLARGQGFTASVLGTVTDASGAVLTQATVTVTNTATGVANVVNTDSRGSYAVPQLPPGSYRVVVEVQGFKRAVREPLTLQVDERQLLNFQMELGQISDAVTVSADVNQIQTETATVGNAVTSAQTTELPLNGRNFIQLNLLVPGAAPLVKGSNLSAQGGSIEVHGLPENQNSFWFDGVDNTTQSIGQYVVNVPAYSISEFRVMSPTYDSEFGRTPGAQINLITRSGGNAYHGDVYLFLRNSVFDAKNFFDPAGPIPSFRRGQYGGDLGGRIIKNKLFFYGAYEAITYAQGQTAKNVVPTQLQTLGNFSDTTAIIKDPTNGVQFAGNIIPANRLNSTGLAYAAFYPAPNNGPNSLLVSPTATQSDAVTLAKGDWVATSKDRLSVHWALQALNYHQPIAQFSNSTNIPGFGIDQIGAHDITSGLSETHIFSPSLVSEFRFGWNRYMFAYYPQARNKDWCAALLIQGCDEGPQNWNVPYVSLSGAYSALGGNSSGNQTEYGPYDTTFMDPTVTWIKERHTIKFGGDWHYFNEHTTNGQGPRGSFTFNGKFSGNALADLLLGLPFQASRTVISGEPNDVFFFFRMNQAAVFVQDDYRVNSHLTLNLGLRYELQFPGVETRNHMANLDLSNGVAKATLLVSGQNGVGNQLYSISHNQYEPRFGFAYTPREKWVVRGGYGIFYQLILQNSIRSLHNDPPFQNTYTIVGNGTNITINNALINGLVANVPSFTAFSRNINKVGMVQQFSLDLQHELPFGIFADLGYVGNRGRDIDNTVPINTPPPGPGAVQARRPNSSYAGISLFTAATTSQYDGLEMKLEKRLSKGMHFLLSWTRSRALDNTGTVQDPTNLRGQWGPSGFDVPNHWAFSYVYELPFGKGRMFAGSLNRAGQAVLGGWQLNGIYQYHSGQPFTPVLPVDNSNTLQNSDRPNLIGDPYASTASCHTGTPNCWVNAAAFATPPQYTFGNAGNNELRGPAFSQLDFSIAKNFAFGEKRHAEFRAEAFNILNHVNLDNPVASLSTSFGVITTAQAPRQLQFGVRFVF